MIPERPLTPEETKQMAFEYAVKAWQNGSQSKMDVGTLVRRKFGIDDPKILESIASQAYWAMVSKNKDKK